ncbi:MAG: DUF3105 domain-containing protein [Actinomycetota bacterium]
MAKSKKRRKRPRAPAAGPGENGAASDTAPGSPGPGEDGARSNQKRRRKEEARRRREEQARRMQRIALLRRTAVLVVISAVSLGTLFWFFRAETAQPVSAAALEAGRAGGCGDIQTPAGDAPGGNHQPPYTYADRPATSGPHDPTPMPEERGVFTEPLNESKAVHNLEHAYVILYYRPDGLAALPSEVVDRLGRIAESEQLVYLAPYPDLPGDTAFAMTAWNTLWTCPAQITPDQATTAAQGFVTAYRGTSNAPEPPTGL